MFIADEFHGALEILEAPSIAVFLYGSYARGDAGELSDVDILQVTPTHTPPYTVKHFNITCYTPDQLLRLAKRGSLFIRHLITEARTLADPEGLLSAVRSAYVAPASYHELRETVAGCLPLLDVDEAEFAENADGLSSLASYLVRTYLYASAFDRGATSFSMAQVLNLLGQQNLAQLFFDVRKNTMSSFAVMRKILGSLTGKECKRNEGSLEAFIVNSHGGNELATILGLRLLARGRPFTYDALLDLER